VLFFQRPRPPLPFGLSLRRIPVVFAEVFGEFVVFFFVGELRVDGLDGGAVLEGERVGVAEAEGISSSASSFARRGMASREEALDGESAIVGDGGDGGGDVGVNVENR
jgi:hypothetical protein